MQARNGRRKKVSFRVAIVTGPKTLAGKYLRRFWQPVYRGEDLAPGAAVPIRIMGEDFTLYRGRSGKPHIVGFRCAHRGTQLSSGRVEDDCLRCFYHGWKYDGTGQCVEQPGEAAAFAKKVTIPSWPTEEYLGLIFGYFGKGVPPPLRRYPDFEDEEGVLTVYPPETWPCNYFSRLENDCDPAHVPFTHFQSRSQVERHHEVSTVSCEETDYGIRRRVQKSGGEARDNSFYMPNVNHVRSALRKRVTPDAVFNGQHHRLLWRVPVDDQHCLAFTVDMASVADGGAEAYRKIIEQKKLEEAVPQFDLAECILAGKIRLEDIVQRVPTYNLSHIEDYVSMVGQGAIADREHEHLGRMDAGVILLRKLWQRELAALAGGGKLKEWRIPKANASE